MTLRRAPAREARQRRRREAVRYAVEARKPYYAGNIYRYVCRRGASGQLGLADHPDVWEAKEEADEAARLAAEQYGVEGYRFRVRDATRINT
jgi:hypothetical protein